MRQWSLVLVGLVALSSGCVSKSKYNNTLAQLKKCQASETACKAESDKQRTRIGELEGSVAKCTKERDDALAKATAAEKLTEDLRNNIKATKTELEELRKQRAEAEKRLAAFRALTAKFQKMIDTGKIKVGIRNGLMILKLPAGVLFASGKAELSDEGQKALTEVAEILKGVGDRKFMIAGHTDTVPLPRHGKYKTNWELSSARALTVTQFLIEAGVKPSVLSAAGYGEFDPVGDNTTEEGRQENRRIEIVLLPNIEELPKMPD